MNKIDMYKEKYAETAEDYFAINDALLCIEEAIIEGYGEKGLEKVLDSIQEKLNRESSLYEKSRYENTVNPKDACNELEEEKIKFGYTKPEMYHIEKLPAIRLLGENVPVFLLFPDNTEKQVTEKEQIEAHDGLIGVLAKDLELHSKKLFDQIFKEKAESAYAERDD